MKTRLSQLGSKRAFSARLPVRLLALLTLALLPIGLIAVLQTMAVVEEVERLGRRDILVTTADATNAELSVIERAIGAAQGLSSIVATSGPDSPQCSDAMNKFIAETPPYILAIFVNTDRMVTCSSKQEPADLSNSEILDAFFAEPGLKIDFTMKGQISETPVMVVLVPVYSEGLLLGAVSISIPHSLSQTLLSNQIEDVDIALLDRNGKIISASTGLDGAAEFEEAGIVPSRVQMGPLGTTRTITTGAGEDRLFAIVPLIRGEVYVVGQWSDAEQTYSTALFGTTAPVFPVLMWLASLFVAYLAIDRLVLKHLNVLRRRMARFSLDQPERDVGEMSYAPAEVSEIANSFNIMIDRIVEDHARLEDSVREKDILLKEVHHRVKNNLQLIASILNMQLRTIDSENAQRVLRRVQDRVIALSLIHKLLYTDTHVSTVRADQLLDEIIKGVLNIGSSAEGASKTDWELGPVVLDPDQAVPLSLLVTEALTNAVKYAGTDESKSYIRIAMSEDDDNTVHLRIANSRGERAKTEGEDGTGLGSRLIQAFVSQLGGDIDITETESDYTIDVKFPKLDVGEANVNTSF